MIEFYSTATYSAYNPIVVSSEQIVLPMMLYPGTPDRRQLQKAKECKQIARSMSNIRE